MRGRDSIKTLSPWQSLPKKAVETFIIIQILMQDSTVWNSQMNSIIALLGKLLGKQSSEYVLPQVIIKSKAMETFKLKQKLQILYYVQQ